MMDVLSSVDFSALMMDVLLSVGLMRATGLTLKNISA
jgi:hypothetical protein